MKVFSILIAVAAAVKIQDPLSRDQEARAVENEVTFRVVHMLDSDLMHPDDADHNAAKAAFQGKVDYTTGDFIKKELNRFFRGCGFYCFVFSPDLISFYSQKLLACAFGLSFMGLA